MNLLASVDENTESFREKLHNKRASLTPVEAAFLHALLIDPPPEEKQTDSERSALIKQASKRLDDDILFSIPVPLLSAEEAAKIDGNEMIFEKAKRRPTMTKKPKDYRMLVGLWQAHEDGVSPKKLIEKSKSQRNLFQDDVEDEINPEEEEKLEDEVEKGEIEEKEDVEKDEDSTASDVEVRGNLDEESGDDSSWGDSEVDHFDAWQVLKDEYAGDFGFDYTIDGSMPNFDDDQLENPGFKILGTSADDTSAHPHVLSPPLIDAVTTFIPDHLQGQNLWLKYSLVRDGASLETFKQYARASKDTILAIETTKGDVFGCYTSVAWRTNPTFFGGKSLVWKMRHNRHTPCHSLFEQAEMESEIDVFMLVEEGVKPQVCTSDRLAIGVGKLRDYDFYGRDLEEDPDHDSAGDGFAIALQDDLLCGTTSKCHTYRNPCLMNADNDIETFEVLNMELWTFTPCFTLDSAEKLEMTQFFMSESLRNASIASDRSNDSSIFSSRDLDQHSFYRRIGHDDANEEIREQWQYRSMMDGNMSSGRGMVTPRFNNAVASRK